MFFLAAMSLRRVSLHLSLQIEKGSFQMNLYLQTFSSREEVFIIYIELEEVLWKMVGPIINSNRFILRY